MTEQIIDQRVARICELQKGLGTEILDISYDTSTRDYLIVGKASNSNLITILLGADNRVILEFPGMTYQESYETYIFRLIMQSN